MVRIAVFASGEGTNAMQLVRHFKKEEMPGKVVLIITNNPDAPVILKARDHDVKVCVIAPKGDNAEDLLRILNEEQIGFIVLAGYLKLVPIGVIRKFHKRIINIHPSLLPEFGGKGMYGARVHEAVIASGRKETGVTIHYVNENFDEGETIVQSRVPVTDNDTPLTVMNKVRETELQLLPVVTEELVGKLEVSPS
jgi:phosphoribosylglycinamide formyltransferase-1